MRTPTVLGSYVAGDTLVHRLDPRVKLALAGVFLVAVFLLRSWGGLLFCALAVVLLARAASVPRGWLRRSLTPLMPLLLITWALNAALPPHADRVGFALAPLAPFGGPDAVPGAAVGVAWGAFVTVRIAVMVAGTALLALTTSPRALADAMAFFGRPLALVRVPVDEIAMMMTIALRFMPTLAEELAGLVRARMARGADFGGPLGRRAQVWATVLVPLFVGLFRRADELATAMEARGYRGGRRGRLHPPRAAPRDAAATLAALGWMVVALLVPRGW